LSLELAFLPVPGDSDPNEMIQIGQTGMSVLPVIQPDIDNCKILDPACGSAAFT